MPEPVKPDILDILEVQIQLCIQDLKQGKIIDCYERLTDIKEYVNKCNQDNH